MLVALAGLACVAQAARADVAIPGGNRQEPAVGWLSLRTGSVEVSGLEDLLAGTRAFEERAYVLVLREAMKAQTRAGLEAAGVSLLEYIPTNAFLADLRGVTPEQLRGLGTVASVHAWQGDWKVAPELLGAPPSFATPERVELSNQGRVGVSAVLFSGANAAEFVASLHAVADAQVLESRVLAGNLIVDLTLPAGQVALLAEQSDVLFAEPLPEFTLRSNSVTRWVLTTNDPGNYAFYEAGLTGVGQVVGVIDSRIDVDHCAFSDGVPPGPLHRKLLAYNASPGFAFHGTHTSGILAGNDLSNASVDLKGMAFDAKICYNFYPSFGEAAVYERFDLHRTQGAFIHSNSWGNDATRQYDSTSRAVDNFMWTNEDQFLAFSSSNSQLVTNPENAKNVLSVSSSRNAPQQEEFCGGGAGPTLDGRRKPDVVAPGCAINSAEAMSACGAFSTSGTSMACPAATGMATLVRQYLVEGRYPTGMPNVSDAFVPSGQLIKALLINSANPLSTITEYPGTRQGWGRVLIDNVLFVPGRTPADVPRMALWDVRRTDAGALSTGQSTSVRVQVNGSGQALEVTMAFTDAPGAVFASDAEVNNLDLVVVAPDGAVYRGNNFVNGVTPVGGSADGANSVEQVIVPGPQTGVWTISVVGANVNVATQGYGLVATGDLVEVGCNDIDFNNDGAFFDPTDIDAFLSVFSEGPCIPASHVCDDIDFNNDGSPFDPADIDAFLRVFGEGPCVE